MESSRYSRQVLFWPSGEEGQERLRRARVLVVGCGALGSRSAEELARAGVGTLVLVDRDVVSWSNLHRQTGFEEADARDGNAKAEALARRLHRVNSEVSIEPHPREFDHTNALRLAEGADLLLDGTDNLPARFLLNDVSYRLGVPWIYTGAIGGTAHVEFFTGRDGPCLRCQIPELPPPGTLATCDTAGIVGPVAGVAASWQSTLAIRYLVERDAESLSGKKAILEPWEGSARVVAVSPYPDCQVCARGDLDFLRGEGAESATALCGREAVHIVPAADRKGSVNLASVASRLQPLGNVEQRGRYLRFESGDGYTLTLFEDGRGIFDGLTDPDLARNLYARLVGQ